MLASLPSFRQLPAALAALALLAGCQASPTVLAQVPPAAPAHPPPAVLAAVPPCPDGLTAMLADGIRVHYQGAARHDSSVCLVAWRGRVHRYFAGFWGGGRLRKGTPSEWRAIRQALTGAVGTTSSFQDARARMWVIVTVEHVASPVLPVSGELRRTVQLRIVRHDSNGRPNVRREAHWIDIRTGVVLKRQTITRLRSGERQAATTWRVEQLTGDAP